MSTAPQGGVVPEFTIGDRLRKAREAVGIALTPSPAAMA